MMVPLLTALLLTQAGQVAPNGDALSQESQPNRHALELHATFITGWLAADWLAASVSVIAFRPWVVEVGGRYGASFAGFYARAGYDFLRFDFTDRTRRGWEVDLGPQVGFGIGSAWPGDGPARAWNLDSVLAFD